MTREEIARIIDPLAGWDGVGWKHGYDSREEAEEAVARAKNAAFATADLILAKLHQDAGNEELVAQARDYIDGYHGKTDLRVGPLMLLHMVERLADALERGSQVGDGWVIVPREPTPAMLLASEFLATGASRDDVIADYRAMLAAAPAHGGGE